MTDEERIVRLIAPRLGASFVTNFAPDPTLPGPLGYVPLAGFAERLGGFAGALGDLGATGLNMALGTNFQGSPQFLRDMGEHAANTEDQLTAQLGGVQPETPAEKIMSGVAGGVGGLGPMLPASVLSRLSGPARLAATLLPGTKHIGRNAAVGGTFGAGAAALPIAADAVLGPEQAQAAPTQQDNTITDVPGLRMQPSGTPREDLSKPLQFEEIPLDNTGAVALPAAGSQQTVSSVAQEEPTQFSELGQSPYTPRQAAIVLGTILLGGIAGRTVARYGTRMSAAGLDARMNDPDYAIKAADYNNSKIARTGNQVSPDTPEEPPPMPSANSLRTLMTSAKTYGIDATMQMQEWAKLTSDNPTEARKLAAQFGRSFNDQMWLNKLRTFLETGSDPESGIKGPAPYHWDRDMGTYLKQDPEGYRQLERAMVAQDELLDNRRNMLAAAMRDPNASTDPDLLRHNFYHQSNQDLQAEIDLARSDPRKAELMDRGDMIMNVMLDIARAHDYITDTVWRDIRLAHQHYVPEGDVEGRIRHTLGQRVLSPGGGIEQMNTKVTSLRAQHIADLYHDIYMNDMRREYRDHRLATQAAYPNSAQSFYETVFPAPGAAQPTPYPIVGSPAVSPREPIVAIRDNTGVRYYRVDQPDEYQALSGNNLTKANIHFDAMSKTRQLLQAGTTGAASLATGRIMPLRVAGYTAMQAPANATGGLYGGPVSALTRGVLPKTLTAPFDIAGNIALAPVAYMAGVGQRALYRLGTALRVENNSGFAPLIRAAIGRAPMRALSDSLLDLYERSPEFAKQEMGIGGQSLQQRMRMPLLVAKGESDRAIRSLAANLEPTIMINADGSTNMKPFWINLKRGFTDGFTHASESVHDLLFYLNRNNPNFASKAEMANAVRSVVGDPSVSGAGRIAQGVRSTVPYSNVAVQGTAALGRAFANSPLDTIGAMITGYGTIAALSLLTAFQSKENLRHLTQQTSNQDRASKALIYNGMDGARSVIGLDLPQEARWVWPIIYESMYHLLNMPGAAIDKETRLSALEQLKDYSWEHVDKSSVEATKHGINDAFNFIDFPPYAKAFFGAMGGSGRVDLARLWDDYWTGDLGVDSFLNKPRDIHLLPGQGVNDPGAQHIDGNRFKQAMAAMFGTIGQSIADGLLNTVEYHKQGMSWQDSIGNTYHDWLQAGKDYNPQANTLLWENAARLSMQPPIIEQGQRAMAQLRKVDGAFSKADAQEGYTSGRVPMQVPTYETAEGKVPQDPTMQQMFYTAAGTLNYLNRTIMPEINEMRQQMDAVRIQGVTPEEKRSWMNERTRDLADKWRYVMTIVDDLNKQLSEQAGATVDISKGIDWSGDRKQFFK